METFSDSWINESVLGWLIFFKYDFCEGNMKQVVSECEVGNHSEIYGEHYSESQRENVK